MRQKNRLLNLAKKENVKEETGKVVNLAPVNDKMLALHKKIVKPDFSFTGLCPFIDKYSLTIKVYSGFLLIFSINIGSLKSERIDSTKTTIS